MVQIRTRVGQLVRFFFCEEPTPLKNINEIVLKTFVSLTDSVNALSLSLSLRKVGGEIVG